MTSGAEKFKKRQQERAAEIDKLITDLEKLKDQQRQLDTEIRTAIDNEDNALVKKLVNKQRDMEIDIRVAERTIERKQEQNADITDLVNTANKEAAEYQKKIDQAEAATIAAKKAYLTKLLDLGKLVNEAWNNRATYCSLKEGSLNPYTSNQTNKEFNGFHARIVWNPLDTVELREIDPEAIMILKQASRSREDLLTGRDTGPIRPDVIINKH